MVTNGKIPTAQLAKVDASHYAAPGCVSAFRAWSVRMVALGYPALTAGNAPDSCYRSLAWQEYRYAHRPPAAAYPGTSSHGLGMAIDLGNYYRYPHSVLVREGKKYGFRFDTPSEDWHVKFTGAPDYKTITPAASNISTLTKEAPMLFLLLNVTTKERAVWAPGTPLQRISVDEATEYGKIIRNMRGLSQTVAQAVVTENLSDTQWKLLVRDFGIA